MGNTDLREQLVNERKQGTFVEVQVPLERITLLHGLLLDFDRQHYLTGNRLFPPGDDPRTFHEAIRPVLDRHPLARSAEVRASGSGLHGIIWLEPPVPLESAAAQTYWDHL